MKYLYKYPQREYPYDALVRESSNRSRDVGEFEITDTDAFDDDKYWDVFIEVIPPRLTRRALLTTPRATVRQGRR